MWGFRFPLGRQCEETNTQDVLPINHVRVLQHLGPPASPLSTMMTGMERTSWGQATPSW